MARYSDAGVDMDRADRLVDRIRPLAAATRRPEVIADVGGFAGLCRLPSGIDDPVLVSGTDGVGTKLKIAFALKKHDTVGLDLVAMCANDVVTTGAAPLFFLDYFACGRLDPDTAASVIGGIAEGCKQAGCSLLGGETAEMPGFYPDGEYDLAGFCVGVVGRRDLIDGASIVPGDVVLGLPSEGLHSNGYSLVRRVVGDLPLDRPLGPLDRPLGEVLLAPTRIYVRAILAARAHLKAAAHITGGGVPGNLPRVLPEGCAAEIDPRQWHEPPIFDVLRQRGPIDEAEMRRTFNLGLGMIVVAARQDATAAERALSDAGETPRRVGEIVAARPGPDRGDNDEWRVCYR